MTKCDCGAQAVNSDKHSSWCSTEKTDTIEWPELEPHPTYRDLSNEEIAEWYQVRGYTDLANMIRRLNDTGK